jgi:hypothetical protein
MSKRSGSERSGNDGAVWRTAAGMLVRQRGPAELIDGKLKIHAYRTVTSGYHGLLRVDQLTFIHDGAPADPEASS